MRQRIRRGQARRFDHQPLGTDGAVKLFQRRQQIAPHLTAHAPAHQLPHRQVIRGQHHLIHALDTELIHQQRRRLQGGQLRHQRTQQRRLARPQEPIHDRRPHRVSAPSPSAAHPGRSVHPARGTQAPGRPSKPKKDHRPQTSLPKYRTPTQRHPVLLLRRGAVSDPPVFLFSPSHPLSLLTSLPSPLPQSVRGEPTRSPRRVVSNHPSASPSLSCVPAGFQPASSGHPTPSPPGRSLPLLPSPRLRIFTLSKGRGRRRCTHRHSVRGLPGNQPWVMQRSPVGEGWCESLPVEAPRKHHRRSSCSHPLSLLSPLPSPLLAPLTPHFSPLTPRLRVRGLPRTHPRTTTIPQSRSPLHPLLGERQTPVYPPAFGEGSSAHPPPNHHDPSKPVPSSPSPETFE